METKPTPTVRIPLPFVELKERAWEMWREVEYMQRNKLYHKIEGLKFEDFDSPKLIINLNNNTGFIFATAPKHNVTILCELYDEDWYVSSKTVERFINKQTKIT